MPSLVLRFVDACSLVGRKGLGRGNLGSGSRGTSRLRLKCRVFKMLLQQLIANAALSGAGGFVRLALSLALEIKMRS
ncbi:hypothetical protein PG985_002571 [Apiospora marii]|uniref:Uncharacterized protein n=1 Tax=Apiospora marii TaxID=335849 RepID=A0ABR1RUV5_9PEZI